MVREFLNRDDLDGSMENVRNLTYTLEGQDYEIDLSEENVQRFYSALEPFVAKSRQIKRHVSTGTTRRRGGDGRRSSGGWRSSQKRRGSSHTWVGAGHRGCGAKKSLSVLR